MEKPASPAKGTARIRSSAAGLPEVPGYRLIERLGVGGMGEVYLAEDEALGRKVAIKVVAPSGGWDEGESRERFVREARIMASLSHPNLVQVHTLIHQPGRDYLIMELVGGGTLDERICSKGPLSISQALTLLRQVSDALEAAWEQGIIHRDIKPSNILLDGRSAAKVVDFGLAKPFAGAESLRITQTGTVIGTPCYMSPEHAGEGEVSFQSDIYSLGLVLYEMLAGSPPFQKMGALTVVARHISGDLPDLAAARPDLPELVVGLYRWMTQRKPAQRPPSYAALRKEIDAILGVPAIRAQEAGPEVGPGVPPPRERFQAARPRLLLWAAVTTLAMGAGFASWLLLREYSAKPDQVPPASSPQASTPAARVPSSGVEDQLASPRPLPLQDQASPDTPASSLAGLLTRLGTGSFGLRLDTAGGRLEARAQREASFVLFLLTNTGDLLLLHPSDLEPGPPFPPGSPLVIDRPAQVSPGWAVLVATPRPFEPPIVLGARPEVDHTLYPQRVGKRDFVYPAFDYLSWLVDRLRQDAGTWDVAVRPL